MKALLYHGPRNIRYEEVLDPKLLDSRDVIVKTRLCGICGSDLHIYHGELRAGRFCIGHEATGEVVEKGRNVTGVNVGDRVLLPAMLGCGQCRCCLLGEIKKCTNGRFQVYGLGEGLEGCQAEAVRVPAGDFNLVRTPEGISDEQAILLTDNLPTAYGACLGADISPGRSVAVVGLGAIGLMAVELAFVMGAAKVYAIDLVAERRDGAVALGATAINGAADVVAEVREATGGRMVDCVIEAVGGDPTTELALKLVGTAGTVSILGVNTGMRFQIPPRLFVDGVTIRANSATEVNKHIPCLVPMLQERRIAPERFITDRRLLSEGAAAYEHFDKRVGGTLKTVLAPA